MASYVEVAMDPIVVIGTSAGGLEPLRRFIALPVPCTLRRHHIGCHPSTLPYLLGRAGLPAAFAQDGAIIEVITAKGFDAADSVLRAAVRDQALTALRAFRKRGAVEQIGLGRAIRWKMANGA